MSRLIEYTNGSEWVDTTSHSEREVYEACLGIIDGVVESFEEWYKERHGEEAIKELPSEEVFGFYLNPKKIVRSLFLSGTNHSGGTAVSVKMDELGIDDEWIPFGFKDSE